MKNRMALSLLLILAFSSVLLANKTSVTLSGPQAVAAGTEVTIVVQVSHSANGAGHYTNWVSVKADGKEIARWDFSSTKRPEDANFTREVKWTVTAPVEITAQGNCNLHGGRAPAVLKIALNLRDSQKF